MAVNGMCGRVHLLRNMVISMSFSGRKQMVARGMSGRGEYYEVYESIFFLFQLIQLYFINPVTALGLLRTII
jgi:hypothetical protein